MGSECSWRSLLPLASCPCPPEQQFRLGRTEGLRMLSPQCDDKYGLIRTAGKSTCQMYGLARICYHIQGLVSTLAQTTT